MENFTPLSAIAGGVLIGTASVLLMALNGRVAGISGILGGLKAKSDPQTYWRLAFLAGLIAAPTLFVLSGQTLPPISIDASYPMLIIAGLLVGYGTRLGGGCTSGHGICGISRLSKRSIIGTATFILLGMITTTLIRISLGG
jgi:uncharacterized membrane protein YedE/YeeE